MALTLVDSIVAKQEMSIALANANPGVQLLAKAFWKYQAEHGPTRKFYFEAYSNLTGDTAISDAACKVYFIYAKKRNTSTASFFKLTDHGSVSAGDAAVVSQELNAGNQVVALAYPDGWSQGTGATINASTTLAGTTDSTSGDGPDGFVLVGAA